MTLAARLARLIDQSGPIPVARYMAEANAHYYGSRDPLGSAGDFTTAPEISQMFGELVGLWLADIWARAGRPPRPCYVELGPGRGTLAADARRAMAAGGLNPDFHFVETSPILRKAQAERFATARWHDDLTTLPCDAPLLVVANEFFDALPIRQFVATGDEYCELMVAHREGSFERMAGDPVDSVLGPAEAGTIVEKSPASVGIVGDLAGRIARQGGAALIVDYGHGRSGTGDTLQAVEKHGFADPWTDPGQRDLTAHVDFQALADAASVKNVRVFGPVPQGRWLNEMGIAVRAAALAQAAPDRAEEIAAARNRLTSEDQMGTLFKAMALVSPQWPEPAGFS